PYTVHWSECTARHSCSKSLLPLFWGYSGSPAPFQSAEFLFQTGSSQISSGRPLLPLAESSTSHIHPTCIRKVAATAGRFRFASASQHPCAYSLRWKRIPPEQRRSSY